MTARHPDLAVVSFNAVPMYNPTAKYDRLGPMGIANRRLWCVRHGYPLYTDASVPADMPACWAKFAALERALARHEWVLWADSDALVLNLQHDAARFCIPGVDLVSQSMDAVAHRAGVDPARLLAHQPVNTGVFLLRAAHWTRDLLARAAAKRQYAGAPGTAPDAIWDGIGDQEALIAALAECPGRIAQVDSLQCHPALYRPGVDLFVHFWGNHAAHRIAPAQQEAVLGAWETAVARGGPVPADLATFHWCCIQQRAPGMAYDRGGPARFLYGEDAHGHPCCTLSS